MNKVGYKIERDFELAGRILEGFDATNIDEGDGAFKVIYTDCENGLRMSLAAGIPVVCIGNRWGEWLGEQVIINGINGFLSNNPDEIRWIIKKLLEKSPEDLQVLRDNSIVAYNKYWGQNESK